MKHRIKIRLRGSDEKLNAKFERCVRKVKLNRAALNPYAVCNVSVKHGPRRKRK
jgi:hypothetical protein